MARAPQPDRLTELAARAHGLLRERGATVATAESLTGGRLASALTAVPGASRTYVGGVVAYATRIKVDVLGVAQELVDEHGVISGQCARAMAAGAAGVLGADWAMATTGVAGPDPQEGHPPGTVHVGVVGPGVATALALELVGDRLTIAARSCEEALSALCDLLTEAPVEG